MADSSDFAKPTIPKFDGFYDHWAMLVENLLRPKEYWSLIETGVVTAPANATEEQRNLANASKLTDLKVKNYLFQSIDRSILETILDRDTAKAIWDAMRTKYQGSTRVKHAQLQALKRDFEVLAMGDSETVDEYFARTMATANKMTACGEKMTQVTIVEKILRSLPAKFNFVVCSIEQSNDVTTLSIDELQSRLIVQEQRLKSQQTSHEEQALKAANGGRGSGASRGSGRNSSRGGCGRGRVAREAIECFKCHKLGHYRKECPDWEGNANYAEFLDEEETLLMARTNTDESKHETWFLDSGCSNHMVGNKDWLYELDESYRDTVKLGDDSKMNVMGKGNVKLSIDGKIHVITGVFYIPGLKSNLLSIGQIQQKNVTIVFKNDICKIYHDDKGLLFTTQMSPNRMYVVNANVIMPKRLQVTKKDWSQLWHNRYGHLSIKGLNTLARKEMVKGLPPLEELNEHCVDCLTGKQHRDAIPKQAVWRAKLKLELVHLDICGPLNPISNGGNSNQGIKRQLTTAYTPQQNGVSERKNRTLLNMVRSMIAGRGVPKVFWPEAVKWATHVMNRSPTLSVKDITPEEAWSGIKPSVHHFRVFGCIAFAHVPDKQRTKLDDKSIKCVHLGVSDESKAYKLYDPIKKKIIISRDVIFEENDSWDWNSEGKKRSDKQDSDDDIEIEITSGANTPIVNTNEMPENDHMIVDNTSSDDEEAEPSQVSATRIRMPSTRLRDYVTGSDLEEDESTENLQNLAVYTTNNDPKSFGEAEKLDVWRKAMDQEMEAIENNMTWELITLPDGANTIDYDEVFAPVARWDTIRAILALAAKENWKVFQLDVKNAFLHGELTEDIYVEQPPGYQKGNKDMVYKLKKALYGLKQAPRAWYSKTEAYFTVEQFKKCSHEHTLFVKYGSNNKILIVSLYVNDLICTGDDLNMIHDFKESMKKKFAMTDLGKMKYFLGVEVCSPIVPGCKLNKDENGSATDAKRFKQMVGCLMYLLATRPDLTYSICLVARFMERPTDMHIAAVNRIMRYLKGTLTDGIMYKHTSDKRMELIGWSDSDYAGDLNDRKSTSGYVFMLGTGAISWSSKKQPIVTLSTTEVEYVATAVCACHCIWLKNVLNHLQITHNNGIVIYCDNSSSIKLSKNPIMHGRCKHIDAQRRDVKSAFLHGDLSEDVYLNQPLEFQTNNQKQVYKLKKALYGLKQAPIAWYSKIEAYFTKEKFTKCPHEHTLFVKNGEGDKILIVSLYVDDLIYTGNDSKMMEEFKSSMKEKFAMTDLGKMKYFLGVEVSQSLQGIFIHQHKYASEILKRFDMEECNKVCSPIVPECKLVKDEKGQASDATCYKQMIGCLMYLLETRPDMTFSVCLAARYMERPTEMHVAIVKGILRYLKGTMSYEMWYRNGNEKKKHFWICVLYRNWCHLMVFQEAAHCHIIYH
ncbi:hypothetical protein TSUD_211600 [Trifolium subterraneum]|uniref:CCHC-type domain-containing protein n=1 Tax=Trifolium subterraneum TaxID=3900 RepID=A0A2Z6NHE7_TRISU|nr:hypothetical protein TSUD_211600 [Trifolium subterraneum]